MLVIVSASKPDSEGIAPVEIFAVSIAVDFTPLTYPSRSFDGVRAMDPVSITSHRTRRLAPITAKAGKTHLPNVPTSSPCRGPVLGSAVAIILKPTPSNLAS